MSDRLEALALLKEFGGHLDLLAHGQGGVRNELAQGYIKILSVYAPTPIDPVDVLYAAFKARWSPNHGGTKTALILAAEQWADVIIGEEKSTRVRTAKGVIERFEGRERAPSETPVTGTSGYSLDDEASRAVDASLHGDDQGRQLALLRQGSG